MLAQIYFQVNSAWIKGRWWGADKETGIFAFCVKWWEKGDCTEVMWECFKLNSGGFACDNRETRWNSSTMGFSELIQCFTQ